jgi:glycosyltransferase involved in cell wall biosynthesis
MIILTTTFNCEKYVEKSLLSIMSQRFKDFTCYITDDLSTDNTVKIIKDLIKNDNRFILIENKIKKYQCGNYDHIIRELNIPDDEICVEIDGDDWLPNSNVLFKINEVYKDSDVWMTSGSFKDYDGRGCDEGFITPPESFNNIRKLRFTLSHLRTWKSWLWKKIKQEDLKNSDGNYWSVAGDLAFMFPMFEMSGEKHYRHIPEITYIYNRLNPLNDFKVNQDTANSIDKIIRNKTPYERIN